jgi:hypothetical protein
MISFWVTRDQSFGIGNYRENRGRAIADRFETRLYDDIGRDVPLSGGPQIFSALDQLTDCAREVVAQIWDAHARLAPETPRLNDPRRVLLRFELLEKLYEEGVNRFRVCRADRLQDVDRFPVFVRHIHGHGGPLTRLLETRRDVTQALVALRLRGHPLRGLMIVEYCDTSGSDGCFRKYAAFKVGDRIIPSHLFVSRHWCVKSGRDEPSEASLKEAMQFAAEHPHHDWLRRVFAIARIDYGRMDYGVAGGVPQVWEINLNPTIGRAVGFVRRTELAADLKALRDRERTSFHEQLSAAFSALDKTGEGAEGRVVIDERLFERLRREAKEKRRRRLTMSWLEGLYEHRLLGRPVRAAYSTLFPRR